MSLVRYALCNAIGIVKLTSAKCKIPNFILTLMHSTDFGLWSAMNPNCVWAKFDTQLRWFCVCQFGNGHRFHPWHWGIFGPVQAIWISSSCVHAFWWLDVSFLLGCSAIFRWYGVSMGNVLCVVLDNWLICRWRYFSVNSLVSWVCERIGLPLVYCVYAEPICLILDHLDPRHAIDNALAHWFCKILHLNAMYHPKLCACAFAWHTSVQTLSTSNGWFRRSNSNRVPPSSIQYLDNSTKIDNKAKHNGW